MKLLFFTVVILFSIKGNQAFAQVLTLPQAIDVAIRNNIDVAQRGLTADAEAINYKQAKLALLPSVNGEVAHGVNRGRSIDPFTNAFVNQKINYAAYGLGSDLTLFNGFTLRNRIRQNGFTYGAAKLELEQEKDNLTLAVILAYLQVLSNEDQVALASKQVAVTGAQVERLEKLNREGAISPPQLYDLKGQLKEAELNRVTAENAVATSKLALTQLMTVPYDPNIRLEKIAGTELLQQFPSTPAEVYKNAIEKLSLVKAAELRKRSAQEAIKVAKGGLYPTLALG
ncbi:MAG TPA: TolC family protein, partial [Flavisolibacter sp.]|nr:TolC family protein [Flavisolibacter sp.]